MRTADKDASSGSVDEVQRIVGQIRARWPTTRIIIRADAGFCRDAIMAWCESRLDKDRWVYVWADGVYSGLRAEQAKLCALVVIGVNERGQKRFLAIEGVRESTQSWREVLLKLKARGMNVPELAIGDGAMGFWAALEEVYPETRQQRCTRFGRRRPGPMQRRPSTCFSRPMSRSTRRRRSACTRTGRS